MKKIVTIFLLAAMIAVFPVQTAQSQQIPVPNATLVDGTAEVLFTSAQRASRNSAVKVEGLSGGHGSGTYVELDGHYLVITARHVIDTSEIFYISTPTEKVVGQVIWKSQTKDMAVLRIPRLSSRGAAGLPRSGDLDIGDEITYTGYPSSYELLTTRAHVSGHSVPHNATLLQGFVWFGYSGSGGFDGSGRLRTIIFAIAVERFQGRAQPLASIVYSHEIERRDVLEIKQALES